MKKNLQFITLALALLGICRNGFAQEVSLDPLTVTSSLLEKRASESGRNIAVVKGEYFQDLPVHSIDDLLRYVPGLEIQARGPMGSQSDVVLRGGTFQQVLVILDGIRINDPNTGHFNSYIPIAPAEIERIEVLKGASSAIYGSEAVGGVVHIITKAFAVRNSPEGLVDKTSVSATGTLGQFGLRTINAGTFLQKNKVAVAAGIASNNADGVQQRGTNGYFNNNTASASVNYLISPEWNVALRSSFDNRDFAAQNFYTTFASDTASEKVKTFWNQMKVGYQKGKTALSLDAGYKYVQDNYLYNPVSIENSSKSQLWQGILTWKQAFNETTALISGLNYQHKNIASNDRGNHSLHQLAPFVSFSKLFGESFTVSPSIRADWRETIGTEVVPQLTVSYKLAGWQLRGSAGKTIRDADFTERYNNYNKALVTGGSVGNPNLKAERSFSYEVGADWFIKQSLKISATAFRREQRDLIDYVTTPYAAMPRKENLSPTGSFALAQNLASVNTSGVEADIHYLKIISDKQKLWLNAGITWLDTESNDNAPSFYVSSHAKFLANFAALYSCGRFSLGVNGLHKTRAAREASAIEATVSKSYFVVNAKLDYSIIKNSLSIFIQADNVANTKYSDLLGAQMPGRWLMGGVKYVFVK